LIFIVLGNYIEVRNLEVLKDLEDEELADKIDEMR